MPSFTSTSPVNVLAPFKTKAAVPVPKAVALNRRLNVKSSPGAADVERKKAIKVQSSFDGRRDIVLVTFNRDAGIDTEEDRARVDRGRVGLAGEILHDDVPTVTLLPLRKSVVPY